MITDTLKTDIEAYAEHMRQSSLLQLARQGKVRPDTVAAYLGSILHLIRHTPIYLELARERAAALGEHELAAFYAHKALEETGHDEWARNDVANVERTFCVAAPAGPLPAVTSLIAYLREAIEDDPARYLAYILFAEYFTVLVGPDWLAALHGACGVPTSAVTVVSRHVQLDQLHVAAGLAEIDALVRDPKRLTPLRETLHQSMHYFAGFCDELAGLAA
jgi:hypothetical protein